ncbi:unnamed protein product [Brassica rapa subsp. trilocularis]
MRLFTNNPSLNWDSDKIGILYKKSKKSLWRHIDFEHLAFRIRKEYYKKTGKAWKRAYLLNGPLGTGKSTMTAAMISNSRLWSIAAMQNNLELRKPLTATSSKFSIVIKDIDYSVDLTCKRRKTKTGLFSKKDGKKGQEDLNQSRVTLSGILNFIDGI